jgi:hypothetical protein
VWRELQKTGQKCKILIFNVFNDPLLSGFEQLISIPDSWGFHRFNPFVYRSSGGIHLFSRAGQQCCCIFDRQFEPNLI